MIPQLAIWGNRTMHVVTPMETVNVGRFNNITEYAFNGTVGDTVNATYTSKTPEWTNILYQLFYVYTDAFPYAFLIMFAIPFCALWVSTGSLKMPGIVGIIMSLLAFAFLPASVQMFAIVCIAISITALAWEFFK